jgi:ribonuclease VapC
VIAVDASAICAILFQEDGAEMSARALVEAASRRISAANWLEAAIVVEARKGPAGAIEFDSFVESASIEIFPVTDEVARAARAAWRRYGKGRHPASLSFGDCFAYGLAKVEGLPLLTISADFSSTDISLAAPARGD